MFGSIKKIWRKTTHSLNRLFAPVTRLVSRVLSPLAPVFQPYKENFDAQWANFSAHYPRLSVWIRRGTKVMAAVYIFYFFFAIGFFGEIPTVETLKDMQTLNTSEVFTADSVLIGKFYAENRTDISFDSLPKHVVNALVATEDERYWEHSGVDYKAFGRVIVRSVLRGDESGGGGSTIPQQLAKNLFGRKRYPFFSTPINKVREMIVATRLERAYDKKNLLAFYLNTVPFGGNVFGVEMAAKRFFNKSASQLKIEEGAVIIGMLKANTSLNPKKNPDASFKRRNVVMSQMIKQEFITQKAYDSLKVLPLTLNYQPVLNRDAMAPHFKEFVRTQLPKLLEPYKKSDGKPYDIFRDGLKIYTSIDSKMQLMAEATVHERMSKLQKVFDDHWNGNGKWWGDDKWIDDAMRASDRWKKLADNGWTEKKIRDHFEKTKIPVTVFAWEDGKPSEDERNISPLDSIRYYFRQLNTGFMAMDAKTGIVKAWVGGTDFNYFQYDHVRAKRQVGSTFKPIVYAKALQAGVRPCEYISNAFTAFYENGTTKSGWSVKDPEKEKAWVPHNSDGSYSGSYSLEGALTNSVNVVTANLIFKVGPPAVRQLAKEMGVTTEMQNDLSIALGSADISLFDMIKVYGTFAARGRRPEPITVLKVTTRDGELIADFAQNQGVAKWQQVLNTEHADMMTKMMRSVVEEGTAGRIRYNHNVNSDIAAKTGTTQSHADGWFMCYTPNLVLGAWVGGITPAVRFRDMNYGQGAYTALPVCGIFLDKLFKTPQYSGLKKEKFPEIPQWVLDSMDCNPRQYSSEELASFAARRLQDSIDSSLAPEGALPTERPEDDNKPKSPTENKPIPAAQNLPTSRSEIKPPTSSSGIPIKSQPPPPSKLGKPGGQ